MGVLNTMTWHLINLIHKQVTTKFGIATCYGLDSLGIEFRWGCEIFHTHPDRPCGPASLLQNGYQVFPGGKVARAWC